MARYAGGHQLVNDQFAAYAGVMPEESAGGAHPRPYHHGNLRAAVMGAALEMIAADGPTHLSLRELARRAGVSHAAPAHHFGDKAGLLTAIAAEGFGLLAEATEAAWQETGSFLEVGVAYVRFAVEHPGHFAVMFRPELWRGTEPELQAARARANLRVAATEVAGSPDTDDDTAATAGWALMHGLVTLWLNGNLGGPEGDVETLARRVAVHLFGG